TTRQPGSMRATGFFVVLGCLPCLLPAVPDSNWIGELSCRGAIVTSRAVPSPATDTVAVTARRRNLRWGAMARTIRGPSLYSHVPHRGTRRFGEKIPMGVVSVLPGRMRVMSYPQQSARTRRFSLGVPRAFQIADDGSYVAFLRTQGGTDPVTCLW